MKLAVIFNGQGAHYEQMGLDFAENFPVSQGIYQEAEDLLNLPIRHWIGTDFEQFKLTQNAQPGILVTSLAIYKAIENQLPAIAYMAGLSLGEYTALIAANYFSMDQGLKLVKARGQIMSQHCQTLTQTMDIQMAAVIAMPEALIKDLVAEIHSESSPLYLANYNSPQQIVIGGSKDAINDFKQKAKELGYRKVIPLKVEGPFHTPLMAGAQEDFKQALDQVEIQQAQYPVVANINSQVHDPNQMKDKLVDHLTHPVQWSQTIDFLKENGVTHLLQIGPGHTLAKLLAEDQALSVYVVDKVSDIEGLEEFLQGG